jgi:hypothetical protein
MIGPINTKLTPAFVSPPTPPPLLLTDTVKPSPHERTSRDVNTGDHARGSLVAVVPLLRAILLYMVARRHSKWLSHH